MRAVIVGAGGFGREVRDWLVQWGDLETAAGRPLEFLGFLDDGRPDLERLRRIGAAHLGSLELLADLEGVVYYIGIGDPQTRRAVAEKADSLGGVAGPALIHPRALTGSDVRLGDGTVLCPGVLVTTDIRVGRHVHLNLNVTVGHDTVIGDFVTVNPGATISGDVVLGDRVMIGTGASVNQGLTIGAGSTIGAGGAVVRDIPAGVVAVGVPARQR